MGSWSKMLPDQRMQGSTMDKLGMNMPSARGNERNVTNGFLFNRKITILITWIDFLLKWPKSANIASAPNNKTPDKCCAAIKLASSFILQNHKMFACFLFLVVLKMILHVSCRNKKNCSYVTSLTCYAQNNCSKLLPASPFVLREENIYVVWWYGFQNWGIILDHIV